MINFKLKSDKCQKNISSKPKYSYSSFFHRSVFFPSFHRFDGSFYSLLLSHIFVDDIIQTLYTIWMLPFEDPPKMMWIITLENVGQTTMQHQMVQMFELMEFAFNAFWFFMFVECAIPDQSRLIHLRCCRFVGWLKPTLMAPLAASYKFPTDQTDDCVAQICMNINFHQNQFQPFAASPSNVIHNLFASLIYDLFLMSAFMCQSFAEQTITSVFLLIHYLAIMNFLYKHFV